MANENLTRVKQGIHVEFPGRITDTDIELSRYLTYEQWAPIGIRIAQCKDKINWYLGGWMAAGEKRYGETYAQAVNDTGIPEPRLQQLKFVYERIPPSARVKELSWSHHRIVAVAKDLTDVQRAAWLKVAVKKNLSTRELDEAIKDSIDVKILNKRIKGGGKPIPWEEAKKELTVISDQEEKSIGVTTCPVCEENPATVMVCAGCVDSLHLAFAQLERTNNRIEKLKKRGVIKDGKSKNSSPARG